MIKFQSRFLLPISNRLLFSASESTFKASDITVQRTKDASVKPDKSGLLFGKTFSDHMLVAKWTSARGWEKPVIKPLANLEMHPGSKVLHYAQEIFEGMKAYRGVDDVIRLFRPESNAKRMLKSAERSCLPLFDLEEWIGCVKRFIKEEQDWVPECGDDLTRTSSYYLRPFMIGTEPTLGVAASSEVLFIIIGGPVGPYFPTGFKPVSLLADPSLVRAWPGGTGFAKMGSNYAPTLALQKHAASQGCQQVLWLFGDKHYLTEVGTMNIFIVTHGKDGKKYEVITPRLTSGLILPGITRDSILQLAREWEDASVTERDVSLDDLLQLSRSGKIIEVFGAGTACIVCPVSEIVYGGKRYSVLSKEKIPLLSQRAVLELAGIQYGKIARKPEWIVTL